MKPINKNLFIDQGADYNQSFDVKNLNGDNYSTNGWSANCRFKRHFESANAYTLNVSINTNGVVTITSAANVTSNFESGNYIYDIKLTDANNIVYRFQQGYITVRPKIT